MHSQGERALAMGTPKRDGPNWVVLAGGAIVMAVGIVIGRKQIQCQGEQRQRRGISNGAFSPLCDSKFSSSEGVSSYHGVGYDSESPRTKELFHDNLSPDGTDSQLSWKAPRATTSGDDAGTLIAFQPQFRLYSSESKRPSPTEPSPPASKLCRHLKDDTDEYQVAGSYSSPALRAGLATRHAMVQKLRKHLRSRDGMIFNLQAQVSDQDQVITMHRIHNADLHERLKTANVNLLESNHKLQRLREEMIFQSAKLHTVNVDDRNGHDIFNGRVKSTSRTLVVEAILANPVRHSYVVEARRYYSDYCCNLVEVMLTCPTAYKYNPVDLKTVILEARMLGEKVKRLQGEKQQMESQVQTFSRECELLFKKASALEAERVQLKRLLNEKRHLLEAKEVECTNLSTALANLQDNLETRDRDSDWARSSKVSGLSDAPSENSRGAWSDVCDQPISYNSPDDYDSTPANIVHGDNRCAGDLMRSYNTLFRHSPSRLDSDGSVSKPGSRVTAHGCASKNTRDGSPNYDGADYDNDESVNLSLVRSLQQEVHQLSDVLASRSKAVSQRKLETSRVLTEFQVPQTTSVGGPEENDWEDLSQVLSFSPDGTSAERLQELSHKLEKVAKKQQVEDEIEALCTHQDQIRALKSRLAKLTAKCSAENVRPDKLFHDPALGVADMLSDLVDKLDAQEDQVQQTTKDIQQLAMSLQLSSPYVPRSKKQELQSMLQDGNRQSDGPVFERVHPKDIPISPDQLPAANLSNFIQEQKLDRRSSRSLDRQISFSSLPNKADAIFTPSSEEPPNKLYEFQAGSFDPYPSAKIRKFSSHGSGKSSLRKPQSTGVGLRWDAGSIDKSNVQARTRRVCFSPEEGTSDFSFGLAPKKTAGNPEVNDDARVAGHIDSGSVMDSDDFQWAQEVEEGPDQATSTGVGTRYAGTYNYSQTNYTSYSQPAPGSHEVFGRSTGIFQTSDGQFSSAIGSGTVSGSCSESRDSLRRFLFKPESGTTHGGNPLYDGDDGHEDTTVALEKLCLSTERKTAFVTDDGMHVKGLAEEDSQPYVLVNNVTTKQDIHSGFVGVAPFAARMAYLDVNRSTSLSTYPHHSEVGNQGVSSLSEAEEDVDSKAIIGKENMRSNELFYSESESLSLPISSKNTWENSGSMVAKDIFRCDRTLWTSLLDSQR